ncbi:hypothetical protein D8K62_15555, partial [Listeria monocytogenes]|nr:hypothetical protein [Listeria monocytogenes]
HIVTLNFIKITAIYLAATQDLSFKLLSITYVFHLKISSIELNGASYCSFPYLAFCFLLDNPLLFMLHGALFIPTI